MIKGDTLAHFLDIVSGLTIRNISFEARVFDDGSYSINITGY